MLSRAQLSCPAPLFTGWLHRKRVFAVQAAPGKVMSTTVKAGYEASFNVARATHGPPVEYSSTTFSPGSASSHGAALVATFNAKCNAPPVVRLNGAVTASRSGPPLKYSALPPPDP